MAEAEDLRQLVMRYAQAWGERDREGWLSTFAPDATQEDPIGEGVHRGRPEIAAFWDRAMGSYDSLEIRVRHVHVVAQEAALEWTIVARQTPEWIVFEGVDVFTFAPGPLIASVRAYWSRDARRRTKERPD